MVFCSLHQTIRTMMATHELVVPRSIPITSPASLAVAFHRCCVPVNKDDDDDDPNVTTLGVLDLPLLRMDARRTNKDDDDVDVDDVNPNPLRASSCNAILSSFYYFVGSLLQR